jgi:hypothetical protein
VGDAMLYEKTKILTEWMANLIGEYVEYTKQAAPHRCKVIGIETDKKTGKNKFLVKMSSVKSQISVSYYPEELVSNDSLLCEFSQTDVRAITFYAINNVPKTLKNNNEPCYKIIGQEFMDDRTIFIIKELSLDGEIRRSAHELYSDTELLKKFKYDDLVNIIQTAVQEQTINDIE